MTVRVNPGLREVVSRTLGNHPLVEYVEPHRYRSISGLTPSDPSFSSQWALATIQASAAWSLWPARFPAAALLGSRVRVAVLDTGADCTHSDFINAGGSSTNSASGGQFSFALSQAIVPTTIPSPACPWQDDHGHGTHVAGTIAAATQNAAGVASLGFNAELLIYKVLDSTGTGDDLGLAEAITEAADAGARVISMSLGGPGYSQLLQDAVDYAWQRNALVVAATGNSNTSTLHFPAGANFALGVGATTSSDIRASFSNYGFGLDVMAPGVSILSTTRGGGYGLMSGTSMATPHVSALAALLFAANPGISAAAVAHRILASADLLTTGGLWNNLLGYGRINAWRALAAALPARSTGGLAGQVVDASGSPVTGAEVVLDGLTATTGDTGLFRFTNFPAGTLALIATAAGLPSRALEVVIPPGGDAHLRLEMRDGAGTFSGFVRSPWGDPIGGAVIQALQGGLVVGGGDSSAAGFYSFQVPAGTHDLLLTATGLTAQTVAAQTLAAGSTTSVDFSAPALGRVAGTVRDQAASPVAGVQILAANDTASAGAVTNAAGEFTTLGLPPGLYTVSASKPTYSHTPVSGVSVSSGDLAPLDLTLLFDDYVITGLTLSPSTVGGGASSTANLVSISPAAGAGGVVVSLSSSNPAVAQVPAGVSIPEGATTSAPFAITTSPVAASTLVTIQATLGSSSRSATLTVAPFQISSLSLSPSSVAGGAATTNNRVYLNSAAPPGGATVTLVSSDPTLATPPPTVTIPAGSTYSSYFTIATSAVLTSTPVTMTASYAGATRQATLTLTPVALSSFSVSPVVLAGGKTIATASVRLNGPAPAGGVAVALQSSHPAATPPATVTVPAGSIASANFTIPTSWVLESTSVTLTAAYAAIQKSVTVVLNPTAVSSLYGAATVTGGKSFTATVYLDGPAAPSGTSVAISSSTPVLSPPGSVTVPSGATSASFLVSTTTVADLVPAVLTASCGGVSKTLNVAVAPAVLSSLSLAATVTGGKTLTGTVYLTGPALPAGQTVTLSSSNPAAAVPASLTVPAGASSATFALTSTPVASAVSAVITAASGGVSKPVTVSVTPAVLSSLSLGATVTGGKTLIGTVYLTGPALPAGQTVTLSSSNPAAAVPASLTVPAGASSASFTLTSTPVASTVSGLITAASGGVSKSVTVSVAPAVLSSLSLGAIVTGGKTLTGTVYLTGPALPAGQTVTLTSSNPAAAVPASLIVPAGASSASFTLTSTPVASTVSGLITAASGGVSKSVTVVVRPPALYSLSIYPITVRGGNSVTATVTLDGPAPAGGVAVALASSSPFAAPPAGVTISAGLASTSFPIPTSAVAASTPAAISATYSAVTKTVLVTITP
jgi:subtilisin family serine protease